MHTVLILGDQLHREIASLAGASPDDTRILFVVSRTKLANKAWHRQRLHTVLAGMRRMAIQLEAEGFAVDWRVAPTFAQGIESHRNDHRTANDPTTLVAMAPMSFGARALLRRLGVEQVANTQFLCSEDEFTSWAAVRKGRLRMEDFYRWQRARLGYLMEPDGAPSGGRWNFDAENREPPPRDGRTWPQPDCVATDSVDDEIASMISTLAPQAFGRPYDGLWPTTRAHALTRLSRVVREVLPAFGPHEDAMMADNWHLAHTLLSSSLNLGLVTPKEVCDAAADAHRAGLLPIASAEGFIRQVIGWREYVWGLYWLWGPQYATENALGATRPLPDAFRGGATRMRCVATCVADLERNAFNHHIQRLMVLGNLALLAGVAPAEMTDWMWASFVDGAEWVMVPNVVGMSLHADGGRMATKPYAGGGSYISKMSDYCKGCAFDPKKRTGPAACPFTSLYWDFLARHEDRFRANNRMFNQMASLRRLADLPATRARAEEVLRALDVGEL